MNADDPEDGARADPDALPLSGTTLVLGPSNVGKTTLTARTLERWVRSRGANGVVVLDFGPEVEREGRILGGRLERFTDLFDEASMAHGERVGVGRTPDGLWYGVVDAHAPRAASDSEAEARALAAENATAAATLLERAPAEPTAVFVNDATIALQHPSGPLEELLAYCARATAAVINAFESDELGTDDAVSQQEQVALERLADAADRVVRLP